jgi:hypothetical protein
MSLFCLFRFVSVFGVTEPDMVKAERRNLDFPGAL